MGWQLHENELPGWASVLFLFSRHRQLLRELFFLQNSFDEKQQNCLEEHPLCYSIIPAKNRSIFQE